ncbi:NAD(P)/FAD-dependent oxidoreductase [Flavihumibacter petaseus]|uniref:NADH:ubiquinone reductase (non-electrogenic) n=1 Tax=Flavihumibacter petaseus NBRC 106054 TaxID=1220578 RepID=A0A0E9MYY6_9BACT|nr:NAD(P)/FAD-dependent oxidoreductase [Flavihumibacter petaseus]GAO42616.1 putative oxidoreductase [Flavihumibacter petaseus NBRC 106054]
MKHVVIIGGGFAGVNLAEALGKSRQFEVTLVDRNNYNFFPPLLYQVATGFLDVSNISYPFRKLFRQYTNVNFRLGEFHEVIPAEKKVILSTGTLTYDYLVFSTGAASNFFGMQNVQHHSLPMKTINDAIELRNHFLQHLEAATLTTDPAERDKLLTIVVAGGGPTGVELAGMMAELRKEVVPKDYPELSGKGYPSHIILVDGSGKVLSPMSVASQQYTHDKLVEMGVELILGVTVKDFVNETVILSNGQNIPTKSLIWAAGVTAVLPKGIAPEVAGRAKRMQVDAFNVINGQTDIYAIGDTCIQTSDPAFPQGHPQLAQVAIQQGKLLAKNLAAREKGQPQQPFIYTDKGSLAIIGRNKAVADLNHPTFHLKGFIAWFIWIFVHLAGLINYRNRLKTLFNWMLAYFRRDQSLRMIIRPKGEDGKLE